MPILSLTVFTNPKTTLNFKNCSEDFMDRVIKVDLLNTKLRAMVENTASAVYEEIKAKEVAENLKALDTSVIMDYSSKFKISQRDEKNSKVDIVEVVLPTSRDTKGDEGILIKSLKTYRTATAASNSIPPYFIFNNEEMGKIIEVMPKNKQEFISIKGFGEVKFEKYGEDIINIIKSVNSI